MNQQFDSQQFQNSPSSYGSGPVQSQYRGLAKSYQPTGFVQSQYGQNQNAGISGQYGQSTIGSSVSQSFQNQNPQSFHTANYRGNQQGHDSYLRADSTQPNNVGTFGSSYGQSGQNQFAQNQMAQNNQSFGGTQGQQFTSPQSYHTANYRGNQQGHDNYLRADSTQPNNVGTFGSSYSQSGQNQMGQNQANQSQFGQNQFGQNQFGQNQSTNSQNFQNPQSFHTANYRGNQQGHDSYLRADSTQPNNQGTFGANFNQF